MNNFVVFDFDFTIAATYENILVLSPRGEKLINNRRYRSVHPVEIQRLGICDDEEITEDSFAEFYSIDTNKAKIIKPIIPYLSYYSKYKIHILTARPQCIEKDVIKFLSQYISTKNVSLTGLANSSYKKKKSWILNNLNNYDKLVLFEDNKFLIDELSKISQKKELYYVNYNNHSTIITFVQ